MQPFKFFALIGIILLCACGQRVPHFQGYVEGEELFLASPYSGVLVHRWVSRGTQVKKGDVLFELDPNPERYALLEAQSTLIQAKKTLKDLILPRRPPEIAAIEAQIAQADAQIKLATLRVKRNQTLYGKQVLDKDSLDSAIEHEAEVVQLKAQYAANLALAKEGARPEQIKAQQALVLAQLEKWNKAHWDLLQKKIMAPGDGVIFDTYYKEGEFVGAQKPLAALLMPENIRLDFFIPVEQLVHVHLGQVITFTRPGSSSLDEAWVQYISPEAEYVPPLVYSRDNFDHLVFRVKAKPRHPLTLKPGQPVMVMLAEKPKRSALKAWVSFWRTHLGHGRTQHV